MNLLKLGSLIVLLLCGVTAYGQAGYLKFDGVDGSSHVAPLGPRGGMVESIKPGTYSVYLIVPAEEKRRMPASGQAMPQGKWLELESWQWWAGKSAKIAEAICNGNFPAARLQLSSPFLFQGQSSYQVKLNDVVICNYNSGGTSPPPGDRPMESLSLNFTKITYRFSK